MFKYFFLWLPLPVLAIINGAIRQLYTKSLGDKTAHQVSVFTGIFIFSIYIWFVLKKWRIESMEQAIWIGIMWLGLTLIFEFTMVLVFMRKSLSEALQSYNIFQGELWPLVLIFILIIPAVFYKLLHN